MRRHQGRVFQLAMRFVQNSCDAQDIVQITLLTVWTHLHAFEGRAKVSTWIHRVAVNASLMFLRSRRRQPWLSQEFRHALPAAATGSDSEDLPGLAGPLYPDDLTWAVELRRVASTAVAGLSDDLRRVFIERVLDDQSTEQTARLLRISVPAVKTRLHRARAQLRQAMLPALA